ncbi:hypothetical protein G9A89_020817 [Geosiphon pyriformis]|nr:hypothetical protein G9A89_020817 [Geosiphon pyriformis]
MCNIRSITNLAKQKDIVRWYKDSRNMISIVIKTKLRSNIRLWIINKLDRFWVFTSGLDVGFRGTGVVIVMNNSLVQHVSKVNEIPGHLISVCLLFKNKLSVIILGLYTAADINSMVSKTVNFSSFVVLDSDFNENGSSKSASFKFCLGLGLKVINFILVSRNLVFAIASHFVDGMSEFFDTDYKSVSVSIGLSGLLDTHLISVHKQANQDHFKDCFSAKFLVRSDMFEETRVTGDLNTMWKLLKETILLVVKVVKCWNSGDFLNFNCLIKVWLAVNAVKTSKVNSMVLNGVSSMKLIKHLSVIKKGYHKSKYYEFKVVEDTAIRKTIDHHMENFCSDKRKMIKSILECLFCKVVLDYLVMNDELVVKPNEVKLKVDKIMEGWIRK